MVELLLLVLALSVCEQLRETYLPDLSEIFWTQFLNEGVTFGSDLEKDGGDSEFIIVFFPSLGPSDELMHDVDLQIVLPVVYFVLARPVHVQVIHLIYEWTLSIEVCHLYRPEICPSQTHCPQNVL